MGNVVLLVLEEGKDSYMHSYRMSLLADPRRQFGDTIPATLSRLTCTCSSKVHVHVYNIMITTDKQNKRLTWLWLLRFFMLHCLSDLEERTQKAMAILRLDSLLESEL